MKKRKHEFAYFMYSIIRFYCIFVVVKNISHNNAKLISSKEETEENISHPLSSICKHVLYL